MDMKKTNTNTSELNPLRIDELPVPGTAGVIGMTFCPGKKGWGGYNYHERDLAQDLEVVRSWRAQAVVTLMERHELEKHEVSGLGEQVRAGGMAWFHLPIPDMGVPGHGFERNWRTEGLRLRTLLRQGAKVMIHCLGGLGRTGTIAGRLLVELGTGPEQAIELVRQTRKGAIQTSAQKEHVLTGKPVLPAGRDERHARILTCLIGGALGDALGYRVEFDPLESIRARFGPAGITNPIGEEGVAIVSDDTQMTLFSLEGMLRARGGSVEEALESLRLAWLDWYATQQPGADTHGYHGSIGYEPALHHRRAPGSGTMAALSRGGRGTLETSENDYKGCGAVMRVAPVGFFPEWLDEEQTFELGMRSAALTHGHRTAALAAGAMALMIRQLLLGEELETVARSALVRIREEEGHEELSLALERALDTASLDSDDHPAIFDGLWGDPAIAHEASRGWVAEEALAIGLYAALKGRDLMEVLVIAANHSGDSDSTASVAGQLYGAWQGPGSLQEVLEVPVDAGKLARLLAEHAVIS